MKRMKLKLWLLVAAVLLLAFAAAVHAGDTYHWMLENGEDAYVLCANGQFTIEVNGDDSIHLICHTPGEPDGRRDYLPAVVGQ